MSLQDWSSSDHLWAPGGCCPFHANTPVSCTCSDEVFLTPLCLRDSSCAWIRGRHLHCRCVVGSDASFVKSSLDLLWGPLPYLPHSRTLTANGSISFPKFSFLALAQTSSMSNKHHFQSFTLTPQAGLWDGSLIPPKAKLQGQYASSEGINRGSSCLERGHSATPQMEAREWWLSQQLYSYSKARSQQQSPTLL